jgi:hypothetical protein
MTNKARIKIAAGVTALFLAGVCAAGLAVRDGQPQEPTTATARSVATPEPAATPAGGDRGVASVLGAAVAAATGEHGDVASVLDAAVAAASREHPDVARVLEAAIAAASGEDRDVAAVLEAITGGESEHEDDE